MTDNTTSKFPRQTKIVATLGPASTDIDTIRALAKAGVDVFRLNFSHADAAGQRERFMNVRAVEAELKKPIGIFADLQGPKLRVGRFEGGEIKLTEGQEFTLDRSDALGSATRVQLNHPEIYVAVAAGQILLLDDGKVRLRIKSVTVDSIVTEVVAGSVLKDRKGVNVPGAVLPISALTEKDRIDLEESILMGVDWVALSFVQRPEDLHEARRLINGRAGLIAKIEKPAAVDCLDQLVPLCDAVMVARGDLGVEMLPEEVPGVQKRLVKLAREQGKPVIVATQMLESMIENASPTRAEVTDVSTAVFDGADAVMLSAESAAGRYPVEAVEMMARIAVTIENDELYQTLMAAQITTPGETVADAVGGAAKAVARNAHTAAIVTFTSTGKTTLQVARERPPVPILALTPSTPAARKLTLAFGARPHVTPEIKDFMEMAETGIMLAKVDGLAKAGERVVITAGVPFGTVGSTNILHVATVK